MRNTTTLKVGDKINVYFACTELEEGDPCTVTKVDSDGTAYVVQDEYVHIADIPPIPVLKRGQKYYEDISK